MKSTASNTLSIVFICLLAIAISGQVNRPQANEPSIEVTGKAEITVEPDFAIISVDFTKLDKDLQTARTANEEGVAKMLQIAKKYAIPPQDVSTNNISVSMRYLSIRDRQKPIYSDDGDEIGTRVFQGFEVARSVTIKLMDLAKFEAVFNDVIATQPTKIDDVKFESSRLIELRIQARDLAMKAAFEKAKAMTAAIGQTVGKAIRINEGTASDRYISGGVMSANSVVPLTRTNAVPTGTKMAGFSAGTINIEASVTVVFRLP